MDDACQLSHVFDLVGMIAESLVSATKALPALTKQDHPTITHATTRGGNLLYCQRLRQKSFRISGLEHTLDQGVHLIWNVGEIHPSPQDYAAQRIRACKKGILQIGCYSHNGHLMVLEVLHLVIGAFRK